MDKMVEIKHPELDSTAQVLPESVSAWLSKGWTLVKDEIRAAELKASPEAENPVAAPAADVSGLQPKNSGTPS